MWGSNLWTSGYYANTVGMYASKDTIVNYIKNQGKEEKEYKRFYQGQFSFELQKRYPDPWVGEYVIFTILGYNSAGMRTIKF